MCMELCLGIMDFMDIFLAFKSLQNKKKIRHECVSPMQFPWGNYNASILCIRFRENRKWKIKEKYFGRDNIECENMEMGKDRRCLEWSSLMWCRAPVARVEC